MGQTAIKNYKKLYSQTGGDPSLATRVTTLENNEYKITYFAEISSSTGSITIPTGATILLDQLQGGVDAYVCTIQNGQPTGNFPQTGGGVTVDVSSFDALGTYTLSGTPSSYPVALIYILKIKAKDYSNLDITKILDLEDINAVSKAGDTMYGDLTITTLTASQIVETDANKNLISAAKGTAYNLNLGTTAGTVLEGNRITQTITNGVTDRAPSEDAVFDALAAKLDTVILQTASAGFNPADATTYYMGISGIVPNTTATNFAFKIGYNFRLIGAVITSVTAGTSGTAENNTINFRNITTATSSLISNSVKTNATTTASINQTVTGLNITGTSTDDVCIEWITPTWATNPTTCAIALRLYVEKTS